MGLSTDGEISYGVRLEDDVELPWDEEYGGDIDNWWLYEVLEYIETESPFDENGEYKNGVRDEALIKRWRNEKSAFEDSHPKCPYQLVNVCSGDYPNYILAISGTVKTANRGYPKQFNPSALIVTSEQTQALIDFCKKYKIQTEAEPSWYLSSYMG